MKKIVLLIGLFFTTNLFAAEPQFSAILAAGQQGVRLHLFQYDTSQALPSVKEIFTARNAIDLSAYAEDPAHASEALQDLLAALITELNTRHIDVKAVLLHLIGAENMRWLSAEQQQAIYTSVHSSLMQHYPFPVGEIQTLTEKMQGVYYWLDANYLAGNLQAPRKTVGIIAANHTLLTTAYAVDDEKTADNIVQLKMNNTLYHIFSQTFSHLGLDEMRARMNEDVLSSACYPENYPLAHDQQGHFYLSNCGAIYKKIIQQFNLSPLAPQKFVIFSAAHDIFDFFAIEIPDQLSVEARINYACGLSWENMKLEYDGMPESELAAICAHGIFLEQLFFTTYHLSSQQIWLAGRINQQTVDWPLGLLLYSLTAS